MRYLMFVVAHVVLFSSLVYGAPTVFFKDGSKEIGSSVWTENNQVYLSKSNEIYEYSSDEVKLDETLKYNKLGEYQIITPEERSTVSATDVSKTRRARRARAGMAAVKAESTIAKVAAAPASAPSVTAPVPAASAGTVVKPLPKSVNTPAPAPLPTVQAPSPPVTAPSMPATVQINSDFPVALLLLVLAVSLLIIAAYWIIYERAGQAGWKSLIPFYNMYVLMEISGKPGWWMFLLVVPLVGVVVYLLAMLSLAKKFGRSELFGVGIFILPMIFLPLLAFGGSQYEG
jgi:hypothetical protein